VKERSGPLTQPSSADQLRPESHHARLALEPGAIGTWEWELATGRMKWSAQMFRNLGLEPRDQDDLYAALLSAIHHGVVCYLSKPFDENDLLACIRSSLSI
jgi:hypothetical protein